MTRTSAIRIALCVCLASTLAGAADDDSSRILKSIQDRYNHAKTLEVSFSETYTAQGRPRQTESGMLTLRKPGRMRWDYSTPTGKLFLSDGKDVYLYTPESKKVVKEPLKISEDMRAPLAFLLGKLDFQKEFRDFQIKPEGDGYLITAKAKTDKLPYDDIKLTTAPDFQIRNLEIRAADQSVLAFKFDNEKLNPAVNDGLFKFQMPPGATLVSPEANQ